jgi:hypothetical protein
VEGKGPSMKSKVWAFGGSLWRKEAGEGGLVAVLRRSGGGGWGTELGGYRFGIERLRRWCLCREGRGIS